jgi:hypothetical protein
MAKKGATIGAGPMVAIKREEVKNLIQFITISKILCQEKNSLLLREFVIFFCCQTPVKKVNL